MRVLNTAEITRRATQAINDAKKAVRSKKKRREKPNFQHGERIFIFSHIQKRMVAYSLTKVLNACLQLFNFKLHIADPFIKNNQTMRHMPFNGKKTIPAALRKDLWLPFATITFPEGSGPAGLSVFQKLREYRKRHEHEWGDEITKNPENGYFIPKKKRGRKICDQVANSVADIAYVLGRLKLEKPENNEEQKKIEESPGTTSESLLVTESDSSTLLSKPPPGGIGLVGEGKGLPIQIHWKDIRMTEWAESWSDNVEHGALSWNKNNRVDNHAKRIEDLMSYRKERETQYQSRVEARRKIREEEIKGLQPDFNPIDENIVSKSITVDSN